MNEEEMLEQRYEAMLEEQQFDEMCREQAEEQHRLEILCAMEEIVHDFLLNNVEEKHARIYWEENFYGDFDKFCLYYIDHMKE